MPVFDRADICEAYYQLEVDYNVNGWLRERPSNQRRKEATHVQLHRMGFKSSIMFDGYKALTANGREIYHLLRQRYGFDVWDDWVRDEHTGRWVPRQRRRVIPR